MGRFGAIAFTPPVKAMQTRMGRRAAYARMEADAQSRDAIGDEEREFLAARDSFYMATVGEGGWPYIQHRGGPKGIVTVLGPHTIGFADFRGNRQYISVGNLATNDRVALIFVDYPRKTRLKILARARVITADDDAETLAKLAPPDYPAKIERGVVLEIEGLDWNCPQHIVPRYTEDEIAEATRPLREKLAALEAENAALRAGRPGHEPRP
jgi:predicted pyridoxine 5'-phosphate oxidase superfamily flavin-nucleotide-binding protein